MTCLLCWLDSQVSKINFSQNVRVGDKADHNINPKIRTAVALALKVL